MRLYEELRKRDAKLGDRVVLEDGVYVLSHDGYLANLGGNWFHQNSLEAEDKLFIRLDRPDSYFWDIDLPSMGWKFVSYQYSKIDPIIPTTPPKKKTITIELEEGAEVTVNGKRVKV